MLLQILEELSHLGFFPLDRLVPFFSTFCCNLRIMLMVRCFSRISSFKGFGRYPSTSAAIASSFPASFFNKEITSGAAKAAGTDDPDEAEPLPPPALESYAGNLGHCILLFLVHLLWISTWLVWGTSCSSTSCPISPMSSDHHRIAAYRPSQPRMVSYREVCCGASTSGSMPLPTTEHESSL